MKFDALNLVKLRVSDNPKDTGDNYVFHVPKSVKASDFDLVLEVGQLVAYKKGSEVFTEKGGLRSLYWRELNELPPNLISSSNYDMDLFGKQIIQHEATMMEVAPPNQKPAIPSAPIAKSPSVGTQKVDVSIVERLVKLSSPESSTTADYFKGFAHSELSRLLSLLKAA